MFAITRLPIPVLPFLLLLVAMPAAAQWQTVATNAGTIVAVDKGRINRLKGDKTAAWTRLTLDHPVLDFETQVRYTTVQALNYYDCANRTYATQKRVFFTDGRAMKTEKVDAARQIAIRPESLDARVLDEVCKPRTVAEMGQTSVRAAAAAAIAANDARPRAMHAEMVSAGDLAQPPSVKVADAHSPAAPAPTVVPAEKPRLFDMPRIDKSKAEDPYKGATTPAAPVKSAATPATPTHGAAPTKPAPFAPVEEPSRQQRELMLATSGPRKSAVKNAPVEQVPDYSHVHWGYAGLGQPENWAKLDPKNATCGIGKRQSPIDIRDGIKVDLEPIRFDYRPSQFRIIDNGHTVQVDVAEGNSITLEGRNYPLMQFHFHRPSEERVNGKAYDMVAHLVHKDFDNSYAVIAVLMERSSEHPIIQTLWNYMPLEVGMEAAPPNVYIDLAKLLPENREYYTYMGSLTTPPCTEYVLWMVMKNPIPVSPQQIGIFARLYPNNARPVQPANDRLIKESR